MTPYELEILLHFSVSPSRFARDDAPAYESATESLRVYGVIEHTNDTDSRWQLTEKGSMWMQCILHTPLPVQIWVDDQGCKIDLD